VEIGVEFGVEVGVGFGRAILKRKAKTEEEKNEGLEKGASTLQKCEKQTDAKIYKVQKT